MKVQTDLKMATDFLSFGEGTVTKTAPTPSKSTKNSFSSAEDTAKSMMETVIAEKQRREAQSRKQLQINKKKKNNGSQKAVQKKKKKRELEKPSNKDSSVTPTTSTVSVVEPEPPKQKKEKKSNAKQKETKPKKKKIPFKKVTNKALDILASGLEVIASPIVLGIAGFVFLLAIFIGCCF